MVDQTRFINHSCDPNADVDAGITDDGQAWAVIIALRPIAIGEELSYDYAFPPGSCRALPLRQRGLPRPDHERGALPLELSRPIADAVALPRRRDDRSGSTRHERLVSLDGRHPPLLLCVASLVAGHRGRRAVVDARVSVVVGGEGHRCPTDELIQGLASCSDRILEPAGCEPRGLGRRRWPIPSRVCTSARWTRAISCCAPPPRLFCGLPRQSRRLTIRLRSRGWPIRSCERVRDGRCRARVGV